MKEYLFQVVDIEGNVEFTITIPAESPKDARTKINNITGKEYIFLGEVSFLVNVTDVDGFFGCSQTFNNRKEAQDYRDSFEGNNNTNAVMYSYTV